MFWDNFERECTRAQKAPAAVAAELGFSNSLTTYWRKSGAAPQIKNRKKIADYFGISVEELMKEENPAGSGGADDEEMQMLFEVWKTLPEAERQRSKNAFGKMVYEAKGEKKDGTE